MHAGWPSSWRLPGGRFGAAAALALLGVGAAFLAVVDPSVPEDTVEAIGRWRFDVGTSVLLIGAAFAFRARPGLAYPILAFASSAIASDVEGMSYAARSMEQFGGVPAGGTNADILLAIAVFERAVLPVAILSLYATAPERRLAPWVSVVAWGFTLATIAAPFLRVARDAISRADVWAGVPWWNELSFQLDQPLILFLIAALGALGSLRVAARAHEPTVSVVHPGVTPDRRLLVAAGLAMVLWVPAAIAFMNRPSSTYFAVEGEGRLLWLPIVIVLIAIVAVRWSRMVAWASIAAAYEAVAALVLMRAVSDYLAVYDTQPQALDIGVPIGFVLLIAACIGIGLFAFAAVSIAFLAAVRPAPATGLEERRWAIRGTAIGFAFCAWFVTAGFLGTGLSIVMGIVFLPAYVLPIAVAIVAWRWLVPAAAEAEAVPTNPFRPLRYLETVVAEVLTRRAAHQRRAAFEERDRVATELDDLRSTIGRLLTERGLELAPAGGGPWRAQPPSSLRRPSDRELDVVARVAGGASNEEIATELVLSLKTVETHLRRLFSRYGVTNRTELAVLAVREGWVDPQ